MNIQILSHYWYLYSLVGLIGIAIGILSYLKTYPPLEKGWKIFLASLRSIMVLLLGVLLIEPLINLYSTKIVKPQLAVIFDTSKSMGISDNGLKRITLMDSLANSALVKIKSDYKIFQFSSNLKDASVLPSMVDSTGDATSISQALQQFGQKNDIDNFGAVMLVTDGRQNFGDDPIGIASRLNMPIYTLTVGNLIEEKNLSIDNIIYPAVAYSGQDFKVTAELSANGIKPGRSKIFLKQGSNVITEKSFDIPEQGRKVSIEFQAKAPAEGDYEYTVSTPILPDESNNIDNDRLFAIRILKSKIKIFVGASKLNWEFKFLKQAFGKFDEFQVAAVYPIAAGRFSDPGTPRGIDGLKQYDIVFIIDSSPASLRITVNDLKGYIENGGSIVYIAGNDCLNYLSQYADILPLKLEKPSLVSNDFSIEPSPTQKQHAAILLNDDPETSVQIWRSLPPLSSIAIGIRPTGEVLLESHSTRGAFDGLPVMVARTMDRGRSVAIMGFPLWRSYFGSVRDEAISKAVPDFWRNLCKWLSASDKMEQFKVLTDQKVYRLGEPVRTTAYLYDEAGHPKDGAYVTISIFPRGEKTPLKSAALSPTSMGIYAADISSLPAGKYDFSAMATSYNDTLGRKNGSFTIEQFSLEMASKSPDYDLTRRISDATGGKAFDKNNFSSFPDQLKLFPYVKESQAQINFFRMPFILIILLLGLCAEWAIRKRFRLP